MEWLVTALLKMAKIDSRNVNFHKDKVQTGELLDHALESVEIMLDIRNQTVRLKEDIQLVCDRKWTTEALINLLKNASECSEENSEILIDSGENPIYSWISVTDHGKGLKKIRLQDCSGDLRGRGKKTDMESGCLWLFPL